MFQAPALYPWRTIEKNVALPLEVMGLGDREARIKRVLDLVNLTGFEQKFPWQLSGGMQQRASIARALAFDADLLLMDEPFGALDEIVRDHPIPTLEARARRKRPRIRHPSIPEAGLPLTKCGDSPRPAGFRHRGSDCQPRRPPTFAKRPNSSPCARVRDGSARHSSEDKEGG